MARISFDYVRHGETLFNVTDRQQGWCDSPLTENGIRQAEDTAAVLKDIRYDACYCSDLKRAIDTAKIILEGHDTSMVPVKGLREMSFGTLEGAAHQGSLKEELAIRWKNRHYRDLGGEDKAEFLCRIRDTFDSIIKEVPDGSRVLIVSHRGYLLSMLGLFFSIDEIDYAQYMTAHGYEPVPNSSVTRFMYDNGSYHMICLPGYIE